jgi:hypothetical protein
MTATTNVSGGTVRVLHSSMTATTDTSVAVFTEAARRLAADIANETTAAGNDVTWLREIVRSANAAVATIAAARRDAEDRFMAAREAAR